MSAMRVESGHCEKQGFSRYRTMHPFPDASKLQFLVGKDLEQVCFGRWQIQFNFNGARIFAEGDVEHVDEAGAVRRHNTDDTRSAPLYLHHLLGQHVRMLDVEPFRLSLAFSGGDLIRIFSEEGPYECGQIQDSSGQITVF